MFIWQGWLLWFPFYKSISVYWMLLLWWSSILACASITQPKCTTDLVIELEDKWENLGDGRCNSELNSLDNFFDAGDCCFDPEEIRQCIDSNVFCDSDTLGDGSCQDYNNGPKCDFDLGDCCRLDVGYNVNCTQCCYCQCHVPNQSTDYWLENGWIVG